MWACTRPPTQGQVAQDVARLVTHELVGPAQRPADQAVLREDQGGFERGTQRQAASPKRIGLAKEAERAGLGQLPGKSAGGDVVRPGLPADQRVGPFDGGGQPQGLGGRDHVGRVGLGDLRGAS